MSVVSRLTYGTLSKQVLEPHLGMPDVTNEVNLCTDTVFGTVFLTNLSVKSAAYGTEFFKEPEAWIDLVSTAAVGMEIFNMHYIGVGNARAARLLKSLRALRAISKFMRLQKIIKYEESTEDKTVEEISKCFSWIMLTLFAGLPLIADLKDFDYSNIWDTFRELGWGTFMIGSAYYFNNRVRKTIHLNYTEQFENIYRKIEFMKKNYGELEIVFEHILKKGKNEVSVLMDAFAETMVDLRLLINPVREDFQLDEETGEIIAQDLDSVVMITDLREFTKLGEVLENDIFAFLKLNYFSFLKGLIKKHNGKILNHTGDGLVTYFTDQKDLRTGETLKTKEELSIECAKDVDQVTNIMGELFAELGYGTRDEKHYTGIGLSSGIIRIGDALSMASEEKRKKEDLIKEIKNRFPGSEHLLEQDIDEIRSFTVGGKDINEIYQFLTGNEMGDRELNYNNLIILAAEIYPEDREDLMKIDYRKKRGLRKKRKKRTTVVDFIEWKKKKEKEKEIMLENETPEEKRERIQKEKSEKLRVQKEEMYLMISRYIEQLVAKARPDLSPKLKERVISSMVGIGGPLNRAARIESITKIFPDYNCLIDESIYINLPDGSELKNAYVPLGKQLLKGFQHEVEIYGLKRNKKSIGAIDESMKKLSEILNIKNKIGAVPDAA